MVVTGFGTGPGFRATAPRNRITTQATTLTYGMKTMMQPLRGIRVLEFGSLLAAPFAGSLMGDLGADVIKVEPPGGEPCRYWPPLQRESGESAFYLAFNRNKRAVALDLKSAAGQDAYLRLAERVDIILDNYRHGVADDLGIGYDCVRQSNPAVIYCSVSGFGRSGPRARDGAMDLFMQAFSGTMSLTGEQDGPPVRTGTATADVTTALYTVVGAMGALLERGRTGKGTLVETSLLDSQLSLACNQWLAWEIGGELPERMGSGHASIVPYQAFEARDGYVILAALTDEMFRAACVALGAAEMAGNPEYRDGVSRQRHREQIIRRFCELIKPHSVDELVALMASHRVPCSPINTLDRVLREPQVVARGGLAEVAHPAGFRYHVPRTAIRYEERTTDAYRPAPRVGEHSREVLRELGYPDREIDAMQQAGVIQTSSGNATGG